MNELNRGLRLLLQIRLSHQYYDDGVMRETRLAPDEDTQRTIERYRLQQFQADGQFSLYASNDGDAAPFFKYLRSVLEGRPFVFYMISENSSFFVFSDLPVNWSGHLEYSSAETEPDEDANFLRLKPRLSPRNLWVAGAVGKISLRPEDLFEEDGRIKNQRFSVRINARSSYWSYYVFNRSRITLKNPMVTNHKGIDFDGPEKVNMPNGESALKFTSGDIKFPFRETSEHTFDLVNFSETKKFNGIQRGISRARPLIKGLPVPGGNRIQIQTRGGSPRVYSEMYVYL